jgi:hypothetical protein
LFPVVPLSPKFVVNIDLRSNISDVSGTPKHASQKWHEKGVPGGWIANITSFPSRTGGLTVATIALVERLARS